MVLSLLTFRKSCLQIVKRSNLLFMEPLKAIKQQIMRYQFLGMKMTNILSSREQPYAISLNVHAHKELITPLGNYQFNLGALMARERLMI